MKNLSLPLILLLAVSSFGQNSNVSSEGNLVNTFKTNNCVDTIKYTEAKTTNGFLLLDINNDASAQAISQYFEVPQTMNLNGFEFYATSNLQPFVDIDVAIYLAGSDSLPNGPSLFSSTITIDDPDPWTSPLGDLKRIVNFPSPITVNQDYLIVISNNNNSANNVKLVINSYGTGDGQQEWLCSVNLFGTWTKGYNVLVGGNVFDADLIVFPYVSYLLEADFIVDQCLETAVSFDAVNESSAVLNSRMYNQNVFYSGNLNESYSWELGDGTFVNQSIDVTHNYLVNGNYTITLYDTLIGWTNSCVAQKSTPITAHSAINTSISNLNNVSLEAIEIGASYTWLDCDNNFSIIAGETNQQFFPSQNGVYAVEVAFGYCSDTSICEVINSLSLEETFNKDKVVLYPVPTENYFSLSLDNQNEIDFVELYDANGKRILVFDGYLTRYPIENLISGIYYVQVVLNETRYNLKLVK